MPNRVTQAGAEAAQQTGSQRITHGGAEAAQSGESQRITEAGAEAAQAGGAQRITQFGIDAVQASGAVWVTQVGAEVLWRLGEPPAPPESQVPEVVTEVLHIRRLRRATHLSAEQVRTFYQKLQLDLEAGIGLTTGQGSDPQVMLRWSDDGGHTWSEEHWMSAGQIGQYSRRVIWRRLGSSRDRVFELVVSDPVKWRLLDMYIDATKGAH